MWSVQGTLVRRMSAGAAVLLTGLAIIGGALVVTAEDLRSSQLRQSRVVDAAQWTSGDLLASYVDSETGLRGYILTGDHSFLQPYLDAQARVPTVTARLRALVTPVPGGLDQLTQMELTYQDWADYATTQIGRIDTGNRAAAADAAATGAGRRRFDALRSQMGGLSDLLQNASAANQERVGSLQRRLVALLVIALLTAAAVIVVGARLLVVSVARPVHALADAARAVAAGDLSAPIPDSGAPEIRALAADVRAMRDRLLADARSAAQALDAVEQQGPAVAALHEALAPSTAEVPGLAVAGRLDAAEGLLAGDWYDLIALPGRRLAIVLGDVAGHGPRSAVLALRLKHALAAALRAGAEPGQALLAASRTLGDLPPELFATVLVVTIDPSHNRLTYANAGHPAGLLLSRPPGQPEPLNPREHATTLTTPDGRVLAWIDLASTGPLLSPIAAGWSWGDAEHDFRAEDTLIAYTDGLLEARNAAGEQFGQTRVLQAVAEHGLADGVRLLDGLAAAVIRHTGHVPRRDDQTIVYARRLEARAS